jgi:hypothetical protein
LDNYPKQPSVFFFKLLLLTGESKNEWTVERDTGKIWFRERSLDQTLFSDGEKKREHLPLSSEAIEILQELKNLN